MHRKQKAGGGTYALSSPALAMHVSKIEEAKQYGIQAF